MLLLPCSKDVKISVTYRHIGEWNKQKIGIGKCENMYIGATLLAYFINRLGNLVLACRLI